MALKSPYLAAENPAERRSRALHRFIVASPILLLLAVAVIGHRHRPPHVGAASTPEFDRRVLAYRDRVVAAEALPESDDPPFRLYAAEASRWVAGLDSGRLTALPPAAYEDHLQTGVRGEIFRAGMALAAGLVLASERDLESGRRDEAASGAFLAARLAHGLRGFELQACLQSLLVQRRALDLLGRAWPSLPTSARRSMRGSLSTLWVTPEEIDRLGAFERDQLRDYLRRQPPSTPMARGGGFSLGEEGVAAIRRSVRLGDARIASLLKGD